LRASKWLELLEKVVAISSTRIGFDVGRKINGGESVVRGKQGKSEYGLHVIILP
jgi:hypothetical protein